MLGSALSFLKDVSSLLGASETELQVCPIRCFHSEQGIRALAVSYLMQRIGASVGTEYNRDLVLVVTILKVFEHMQLWLLHSYVLLLVTCMR